MLSWPGWLTSSGRFTHISGHPSAEGRACNRESSPAKTDVLATVSHYQTVIRHDVVYSSHENVTTRSTDAVRTSSSCAAAAATIDLGQLLTAFCHFRYYFRVFNTNCLNKSMTLCFQLKLSYFLVDFYNFCIIRNRNGYTAVRYNLLTYWLDWRRCCHTLQSTKVYL